MGFVDLNEIWKLRDIVLSKISIIDVAKEYGLELEEKSSGTFSHRTFCPFHLGKDGNRERTPSMFFSKETNSFSCFGCNKSGSLIDFIIYLDGCPAAIALEKLAKKIGLIDKDGNWDELQIQNSNHLISRFESTKTIEPYIFDISYALCEYIHGFKNTDDFEKELKWIEKISKKADQYLQDIGFEDWEYAEELKNKIQKAINSRLKKRGS